jgi:hypothetical protein
MKGGKLDCTERWIVASVRYNDSEDEEVDPHEIVSKSNGADLAELLQEAEAPYAQAYYRHRSLLDSISTDLPTTQPTISERVSKMIILALSRSIRHHSCDYAAAAHRSSAHRYCGSLETPELVIAFACRI